MPDEIRQPCPFCGSTEIDIAWWENNVAAACLACKATGPIAHLDFEEFKNSNTDVKFAAAIQTANALWDKRQ